jgi:hypothetical protein
MNRHSPTPRPTGRNGNRATARSRHLAIAANADFRRRYPDRKIAPLHSAEPAPVSDAQCQHLDLIPHQGSGQTALFRNLEVQRQAFRAAMNEYRRLVHREDAALGGRGEGSPASRSPWQDAILQPPAPQITLAVEILQLAAEHDIEPEAGS